MIVGWGQKAYSLSKLLLCRTRLSLPFEGRHFAKCITIVPFCQIWTLAILLRLPYAVVRCQKTTTCSPSGDVQKRESDNNTKMIEIEPNKIRRKSGVVHLVSSGEEEYSMHPWPGGVKSNLKGCYRFQFFFLTDSLSG
jgi:hypothetical protein